MKWTDASSYSQGDKTRIPTNWVVAPKLVKISVHRYHGLKGWFLTCRDVSMELYELKCPEIDDAKAEALVVCEAIFNSRSKQFSEAAKLCAAQNHSEVT